MGPRTGLAFLVCLFVHACTISDAEGSYWCILRERYENANSWNDCAQRTMSTYYWKMRMANCLNCDKYFHCMGNYEAVHSCQGSYQIETARMISDCRDALGCTEADCQADRAANDFGRNGGDCSARYLCNGNCKYNPVDETCESSTCN